MTAASPHLPPGGWGGRAEQPREALAQLARRLVGEGHLVMVVVRGGGGAWWW